MEYRSVFLANPAQLSVRNQQLVIRQGQEVSIPMEDISGLLIESQQVTITSAAMQKLTEYGVTVYFCDEKHLPAALLLPMNRPSAQTDSKPDCAVSAGEKTPVAVDCTAEDSESGEMFGVSVTTSCVGASQHGE